MNGSPSTTEFRTFTGVIFAAIEGRRGRVPTTIVAPTETELSLVEINSAPRIASLSDRFDILGHGFCGDADANTVTISGLRAIVLASSATSLVVLPPVDLEPGPASVKISCGKNSFPTFNTTFLQLELHADASPLAPGVHRELTVSVRGTPAKIALEAKNLAPDIAELTGGDVVRQLSSGGPENAAHFEVVGRKHGSFLISIRLVPVIAHPKASAKKQIKLRRAVQNGLLSRWNYALFFAAFAAVVESTGRASVPCTSSAAWVELVPSKLSSVFCVFSRRLSASL